MYKYLRIVLLISTSCSTLSFCPLTGSTPCSLMYFSISRFSNTLPETGDMTGWNGTSLQTVKKVSYNLIENESNNLLGEIEVKCYRYYIHK